MIQKSAGNRDNEGQQSVESDDMRFEAKGMEKEGFVRRDKQQGGPLPQRQAQQYKGRGRKYSHHLRGQQGQQGPEGEPVSC